MKCLGLISGARSKFELKRHPFLTFYSFQFQGTRESEPAGGRSTLGRGPAPLKKGLWRHILQCLLGSQSPNLHNELRSQVELPKILAFKFPKLLYSAFSSPKPKGKRRREEQSRTRERGNPVQNWTIAWQHLHLLSIAMRLTRISTARAGDFVRTLLRLES